MDQYRNASASHLKFACNGLITFNFFFMKLSKKKARATSKITKRKKNLIGKQKSYIWHEKKAHLTANMKNRRLKRFSEIRKATRRSCKGGKKKKRGGGRRKTERKRRGKACG